MSETPKVGIGELLALTIDLISKEGDYALTAFSFFLVSEGFGALSFLNDAETVLDSGPLTVSWSSMSGLAFIAYVVLNAVIVVFLVSLILRRRNGLEGPSGLAAIPQFAKAVLVYLISYLFIVLGFIALIIPGVVLSARWSVVVPFALQPGNSVARSFDRSNVLARGSTLAIAMCLFIICSPLVFIEIFEVSFSRLGEMQFVLRIAFEAALGSICAVFALFLSLAFYLHAHHSSEELAQIFE